jgi:hypothetical protein
VPDTPCTPEAEDWSAATREGNRRRQRLAPMALPLREKIKLLEEMEEVAKRLGGGRASRHRAGSDQMESTP